MSISCLCREKTHGESYAKKGKALNNKLKERCAKFVITSFAKWKTNHYVVCAKFKKRGDYLWIMMNMAIVL